MLGIVRATSLGEKKLCYDCVCVFRTPWKTGNLANQLMKAFNPQSYS